MATRSASLTVGDRSTDPAGTAAAVFVSRFIVTALFSART
jgi:hypothetical protein